MNHTRVSEEERVDLSPLRELVERIFRVPMELLRLPKDLARLGEERGQEAPLLFASSVARERSRPWLMQAEIDGFLQEAQPGYFLTGFWGHGTNSYAFYYLRVTSSSRVYLRLPFGGIYMNTKRDAAQIGKFLRAFLPFEAMVEKGIMCSLLAVESMGRGRYEVVRADGSTVTSEASMLRAPSFGSFMEPSAEKTNRIERARKPSKCPTCKSKAVAEIQICRPTYSDELQQKVDAGLDRSGGCVMTLDDPAWICGACGQQIYRRSSPK